jgi:hypothetical protein
MTRLLREGTLPDEHVVERVGQGNPCEPMFVTSDGDVGFVYLVLRVGARPPVCEPVYRIPDTGISMLKLIEMIQQDATKRGIERPDIHWVGCRVGAGAAAPAAGAGAAAPHVEAGAAAAPQEVVMEEMMDGIVDTGAARPAPQGYQSAAAPGNRPQGYLSPVAPRGPWGRFPR